MREPDGTFTFAPFSWASRNVGDESTNSVPTFVGRAIRDVFFYQNRLGLLVDENVVFSCAGDFGNYWRNTVLDYVASDVIDVAVTTNEVSLLNYPMRLTFSRQFPQDYQGRPLTTGRLQLRTFTLNYTGTAFFRTEVAPYGAAMAAEVQDVVPAKLAEFTGMVVGASDLILNRPVFHTGSYSFQVYGDAAQATVSVTNDTHVASTFVSAEWEGFYFNRAS